MKMSVILFLAAAIAAGQLHADEKHHQPAATATAEQSTALSQGEIRRVDKDAKKITIKHGPLQNLDMPAMTMVFRVKDPAMLEQVKPGDKVTFEAEKEGGSFVVVKIESVK